MAFVNLSNLPSPPKLRVSSIQNLRGGLNLHDLAWQLRSDQSPEMKNMWWRDGVLQSRPGLTAYNNGFIRSNQNTQEYSYEGLPIYGYPYHGWFVAVSPTNYCLRAMAESNREHCVDIDAVGGGDFWLTPVDSGGTFFLHNDVLYYKQRGDFVKITVSDTFDETAGAYLLQVEDVEGYIPTTYINAKANDQPEETGTVSAFGGGDAYQPVNRLTQWRRITYNVSRKIDAANIFLPEATVRETPSGTDDYSHNYQYIRLEYLNSYGEWVEHDIPWVYYNAHRTWIKFSKSPTDLYDALVAAGTLDVSNNVRVTYKAAEAKYANDLMSCNIVEVYGGGEGLCVVMAGCEVQPNAYFWSGNTDVSMDPTYFPVEHYNLAGDVSDSIIGFGKQQNMLVIFQRRQIGRSVFGTTEIDGRVFITMDYTTISPQIGCDFPRSIQLIENNLVFCNAKYGVMYIKDTSAAYENNVVSISRNVETPRTSAGLLHDVGQFNIDALRRLVTSVDDGKRYWLCANDHVWLWDYSLGGSVSDAKTLSWFYFDSVETPAGWLRLEDDIPSYIDRNGSLWEFTTTMEDTYDSTGKYWRVKGFDFDKVLTLPIQDFGTYEVLKNVEKTIFVVKASGDSTTYIEYETDYESRVDRQPIVTHGLTAWVPRNLTAGRSLKMHRFAITAVRKPRCIHVRHFLVRLKNVNRGETISFISAQIYFTLQGVDR